MGAAGTSRPATVSRESAAAGAVDSGGTGVVAEPSVAGLVEGDAAASVVASAETAPDSPWSPRASVGGGTGGAA